MEDRARIYRLLILGYRNIGDTAKALNMKYELCYYYVQRLIKEGAIRKVRDVLQGGKGSNPATFIRGVNSSKYDALMIAEIKTKEGGGGYGPVEGSPELSRVHDKAYVVPIISHNLAILERLASEPKCRWTSSGTDFFKFKEPVPGSSYPATVVACIGASKGTLVINMPYWWMDIQREADLDRLDALIHELVRSLSKRLDMHLGLPTPMTEESRRPPRLL